MANRLNRAFSVFPLWPILLGLLSGVFVADHHGINHWIINCVAGGAIVILFRRQTPTMLVAGYLLGYLSHGMVIDQQRAWQHAAESDELSHRCSLTGVVIDTGTAGSGPYLLRAEKIIFPSAQKTQEDLSTKGVRLLLNHDTRDHPIIKYGDLVELDGHLEPIGSLRNPHGFDKARWLHRHGVNLAISTQRPVHITGSSTPHQPVRIMTDWRRHLRQLMTAGLAPDSSEAQLIRAVVLGERPPRPSGMIDDFRNSGTLHVFAVSGLHVGMVGTIIGFFLWFVRVPRWLLISGIILSMAIYAGITGLRPPAVRAVIMATVFLSGFLFHRKPSLINSLAASAIVVLAWDGHQLFTPGFQLSYGVLLALAVASAFWMRIFKPIGEIDAFMPRLLLTPWQERMLNGRKWLRNSLSVSTAAWMGSAPLMWIHFGIITPIAVLASVPLMLMVFFILAMAMLGITVGSMWSPAGETINQVNAIVAKATYGLAGKFADIPGGHWYRTPSRPERGRIVVFDLPYGGGANYLDLGGGIMLDCGRADQFYRHVMTTLSYYGADPDSLIVSHADSKHSGAMSLCLEHYHPKQALIPRTDLLSKSYRKFLSNAENTDCRLIIPRNHQRFEVESGVYLEILHAPIELAGNGRADDSGLVIRLHWHGWKILFMGDAGFITETRLLESGQDLSADVIVTGRNRDDFTGREDFYQAVSPHAIISSNCDFPASERITEHWRDSVKNQGIRVFDQQQSGAVTMTIENGELILTPMLQGSAPLRIGK
ncbi:MAG: ComEC/Rec2 family competence protein [Verrucomicrobiae bacterium]|nr:ComEC/Rec2 family competence protein [Verrucomicrobiae bacterium]